MSTEFTNSIGMKFAFVKRGTFLMGSPEDEKGRYDNETQHRVTLTKDFYLQVTAVAQSQWGDIMLSPPGRTKSPPDGRAGAYGGGNNPSYYKGRDLPVECVSWNDAVEFCRRLSKKDGRGYRLPTEAEWEYACRAGDAGPWSGTGIALEEKAWYDANSGNQTHKGLEKKPNAWGLYDMHGNVWEWCNDWYGEYPEGDITDPTGPVKGKYKVFRGGSWGNAAWDLRCATRWCGVPEDGYLDIGFRCVMNP